MRRRTPSKPGQTAQRERALDRPPEKRRVVKKPAQQSRTVKPAKRRSGGARQRAPAATCRHCGRLSRDTYRQHPTTGQPAQHDAWCSACYEMLSARATREWCAKQGAAAWRQDQAREND